MTHIKRGAVISAIALGAPLVAATSAFATTHTDPCPNAHIQVWAEVGNSGAGQATDHFVCATDLPAGPQGPKGDKGDTGATGATGPKGDTGAKGETGAAGPAGDAGPAGPQGPQGPAGADGLQGVSGAPGEPGAPGQPGLNGKDGAPGADGKDAHIYADPSATNVDCMTITTDAVDAHSEFDVCDGADGKNGVNGKDGKDGVTKTVIVNADGTQQVVDGLPHTGASGDQLWVGLVGLGIIVAGGATVYYLRKD